MANDLYHGPTSRSPWRRFLPTAIGGLVFIGIGLFIYADLSAWEANGYPDRTFPSLLILLYDLGGKALAAGVVLALGIGFLVLGAWRLRNDRATRRAHRVQASTE